MTSKLFKAIYYILIAGILAIALLLVVSIFPITGNFNTKIVLSGSMEPAIHIGSVVVIKPSEDYKIGDIITFGKDTKTDVPTTHRIIEMRAEAGKMIFQTKGDANENADAREVKESEVIGKVLFSIPYLGYLVDFAKKPVGFALLVVIPAGIIVIDELGKIWKEITRMKTKEKDESEAEGNDESSGGS